MNKISKQILLHIININNKQLERKITVVNWIPSNICNKLQQ